MAERSFAKEVQTLRLGEGEEFHGEGILAVTKALVDEGAVDTIIIAKLDRLTRSVVDLAELLK